MAILILTYLITFLLGAIMGSFYNVVALRIPKGEGFVTGRSHCVRCGHTLSPLDLLPIFSWLFLGGKCRYCKEPISPRYMLMELATGAGFALALLGSQTGVQFVTGLVLVSILIIAGAIDGGTGDIPYWCSVSVGVIGVVLTLGDAFNSGFFTNVPINWYEHLFGALAAGAVFALLVVFGGMGGGDFQLVTAAGLVLGWAVVPAVGIAAVTAAVYGVIRKLVTGDKTLRFGPFLAAGIAVSFVFGYDIITWYAGLFVY